MCAGRLSCSASRARSPHVLHATGLTPFRTQGRNNSCTLKGETIPGLASRREVGMSVITDRTKPFQDVDVDIVLMIRNEYGEQPGLRLDRRQAARFWSIPQPVCDRALQALTE